MVQVDAVAEYFVLVGRQYLDAIRYRTGMGAAEVIREARVRAGLSQAELGARGGLPQSAISAYERGRRDPSFATLERLIQSAGFTISIEVDQSTPMVRPFVGPVGRRLQRHRAEARELLRSRGYGEPAVFGSVARGDDHDRSDIDLLVDLPAGAGLIQLNRAALDLEALIGASVDLVPREALKPRVAANIAVDLVPL